jgi:hypothetical protein
MEKMVELKVNLKKRQTWFLALLIVAVGFVIAVAPNPGHTSTEIENFDTQVNALIDAKLSGLSDEAVEWKFFSATPQEKILDSQTSSLASWTTTYGRGVPGGSYKACMKAMNIHCIQNGYDVAIFLENSCGWSVNSDDNCPDSSACKMTWFCLRTAT